MPTTTFGQIYFTRQRIYLFIVFNSMYAFLTFWTVANLLIASSFAIIGLIAYGVALFLNYSSIRWVTGGDKAYYDTLSDVSLDRPTFMRLLFGNFVIFLSCIYSIGKSQIVAIDHYKMFSSANLIIGLIIFVIAYIISFYLTFVKQAPDVHGSALVNSISSSQGPNGGAQKRTSDTNVIAAAPKIVKSAPVSSQERDLNSTPAKKESPAIPVIKKEDNNVRNFETRAGVSDWDVFAALIPDRRVRSNALSVLRRTPDWSNVSPSQELFEKKGCAYFQQEVIRSLGDASDQAAIPFLIELLGKTYDLTHGNEAFRRPRWPNIGVDAASALARIGATSVEYLRPKLHSQERLVRLYAVCGIALLRETSMYSALTDLVNKETDPVVHSYIKRTIAHFERKEYVSPNFSGLILAIEAEQKKVRTGEPIRFSWIISNSGTVPLIINKGSTREIKQIFSTRALQDQYSNYLAPYDSDSTPGADDLVTLSCGESYRIGPFDLREYFDLKKPGPYEVQGIYRNHFPGIEYGIYVDEGKLVSSQVEIVVTL